MKESDIVHEIGDYWVARQRGGYTVFRSGSLTSVSDSTYARDDDGHSLAVARANYLAKRDGKTTQTHRATKTGVKENHMEVGNQVVVWGKLDEGKGQAARGTILQINEGVPLVAFEDAAFEPVPLKRMVLPEGQCPLCERLNRCDAGYCGSCGAGVQSEDLARAIAEAEEWAERSQSDWRLLAAGLGIQEGAQITPEKLQEVARTGGQSEYEGRARAAVALRYAATA